MFLVGEADCFAIKKPDFGATAAIKKQRRVCQILGVVAAGGGVRLQRYNAYDGGDGERCRSTS